MTTFADWLESLDQRRTVLLEVDYLTGGSPGTLRLSNRPFRTAPSDSPSSFPYEDVILDGLTYTLKMGGQESGTLGLSVGSVTLAASPEIQEASLFEFSGRPARVYLGDSRWPLARFQLVAVLTVESLEPETVSEYRLNFRTSRPALEKPLNSSIITIGPNKDRNLPLLLGSCLNIRAVQIDASGLTWAISDGPVASIGAVRVDGIPATVSRNISAGTFTFASAPSGVVTCDAVGTGGTRLKDVVLAVLSRLNETNFDSGSLERLPLYSIGLYSQGAITAETALDQALRSVGGFWGFDRLGRFRVGLLDKPKGTPTASLSPDDILEDGVSFQYRVRPAQWVDLVFDANYTNQSGDLDPGVSATDRAFWSGKGQTVKAENLGILSLYPDAEQKIAETLLRDTATGQVEANRRRDFYSRPLRVFRIDAFAVPFSFQIGQEIRVFYPFFGMEGGKDAVILSILDDPLSGKTSLEVLI